MGPNPKKAFFLLFLTRLHHLTPSSKSFPDETASEVRKRERRKNKSKRGAEETPVGSGKWVHDF